MKRLLLIAVVVTACMAFVHSVQAQVGGNYLPVPLPNYEFAFIYPSSMPDGGDIYLVFNAPDGYQGNSVQLEAMARGIVDQALRLSGVGDVLRLESFDFNSYPSVAPYVATVHLKLLPAREVGQADLDFMHQSQTIRNY